MRVVHGNIVLPSDALSLEARVVLIELRDVSILDAPSQVMATQRLEGVPLKPHARIPFSLEVPEVEAARALSLRVHVDVDGDGRVAPGDLLTTAAYPVPTAGDFGPLEVRVMMV